jgi:hypothetical protein
MLRVRDRLVVREEERRIPEPAQAGPQAVGIPGEDERVEQRVAQAARDRRVHRPHERVRGHHGHDDEAGNGEEELARGEGRWLRDLAHDETRRYHAHGCILPLP